MSESKMVPVVNEAPQLARVRKPRFSGCGWGRRARSSGLRLALGLLLLPVWFAGACTPADAGDPPDPEELRLQEIRERTAVHVPVHVDSIHAPDEEIRRFREGLVEPNGLRGGAETRDTLVEKLIRALEAADTARVASLAMDRAEFAWFYYPHSIYTAPPYALPPGLVWYQMENRSSRGLTRLQGQYAGETLYYAGYTCPDEGEEWGEGWIWHGCIVLGELPTGESVEERLFGSILELDRQFKLVSFSNEL